MSETAENRRIHEVLDWPDDKVTASAFKDARATFPHHPLVLLCLAEDCYLGARLRQQKQRLDLAKVVAGRACKLATQNETCSQFLSKF